MKKITLIGAVALALAAGTVFLEQGAFPLPTSASPAISFQDVPSDYWAKDAIQTAVDNGYVIGKSEGIFDPEASVTRAEFIKMVVTAEKLPVSGETTGKDWYGPYVNAAVQNGIHAWSDFTYGDWNTPLTRAELARLAVRGTGTDNTDDKKWLYLATKAGLIQGMDNTGTLAEDGTTTRAQSVTIIERILAVKRGETLPADKHAVSRAEVAWHKTNIETMLDGDYIDVAATPENDRFDPNKLYAEADNGNVRGWADGLFVVDLDDPNDPYRYLLERAYAWYGNQEHLLPSGAFALISVNNVEVKFNTYNLKTFNNASYLGFYEAMDYGTKELFSNDKLSRNLPMVFYFPDGDRERPQGTTIIENTIYTSRYGRLFPKLPGRTLDYDDKFQISFRSFGDFGNLPVHYFNYALPDARKRTS